MPSESGRRVLTRALVVLAAVLAVAAVVLVSSGPDSSVGVLRGGDSADVLDTALAEGIPSYILIHSAT